MSRRYYGVAMEDDTSNMTIAVNMVCFTCHKVEIFVKKTHTLARSHDLSSVLQSYAIPDAILQ